MGAPIQEALALLRAQAASFQHQIDVLAGMLSRADSSNDLLDVTQARSEFGVGRDSLKNAADRGELAMSRGARGKLLVSRSELRRWLTARPYQARKTEPCSDGFDAIDHELAMGGLVRAA